MDCIGQTSTMYLHFFVEFFIIKKGDSLVELALAGGLWQIKDTGLRCVKHYLFICNCVRNQRGLHFQVLYVAQFNINRFSSNNPENGLGRIKSRFSLVVGDLGLTCCIR